MVVRPWTYEKTSCSKLLLMLMCTHLWCHLHNVFLFVFHRKHIYKGSESSWRKGPEILSGLHEWGQDWGTGSKTFTGSDQQCTPVCTLVIYLRGADCLHSSFCLSKHWFRLGDGLWLNPGTRTTSRKCCVLCRPTIAPRLFSACLSALTPKTPPATLSRWGGQGSGIRSLGTEMFNTDSLLWKCRHIVEMRIVSGVFTEQVW